jgi:hypothetical protein
MSVGLSRPSDSRGLIYKGLYFSVAQQRVNFCQMHRFSQGFWRDERPSPLALSIDPAINVAHFSA